jgi:gas vesicle protein
MTVTTIEQFVDAVEQRMIRKTEEFQRSFSQQIEELTREIQRIKEENTPQARAKRAFEELMKRPDPIDVIE